MKIPEQVEALIFKSNAEKVAAGLSQSAHLLLALHRVPEKGGFWQPLTGGVEDFDQDHEAAIVREIAEELSLQKEDIIQIFNLNMTFKFEGDEGVELEEFIYGVEVSPKSQIILSDEHDDARWTTLEEAQDLYKWHENKQAVDLLRNTLK